MKQIQLDGINVTANGTISYDGEEAKPTIEFWKALSSFMREMYDQRVRLDVEIKEAKTEIANISGCLLAAEKELESAVKERKRYIPIVTNKKGLFAAGIAFGKKIKCT